MTKLSNPLTLAWLSIVTALALGVWGWSIAPEQASRWAFIVFLLPAFWGFMEFFQGGTDLTPRLVPRSISVIRC